MKRKKLRQIGKRREAPRGASGPVLLNVCRLALRELERPAGLGATVLLALDDARVAGQEATLLQDAAQLRFEVGERLRQAVAYRAGLARQAAAGHRADHVILAIAIGGDQRLLDQHAQHRTS